MKIIKRFLILFAVGVFFIPSLAFVQAVDDCSADDYECVTRKIEEYRSRIIQLQGEQKSLSSTIFLVDQQTRLTEGEIKKTELEIAALQIQIEALEQRIEGLEISLQKLSEVLIQKIREDYKNRKTFSSFSVFSSQGIGEVVLHQKYLSKTQQKTQVLIEQAEHQKIIFDQERLKKEEKQTEMESLQKKLQVQRTQLANQRKQKQSLLEQTKNDEQKYQSLLSQALAEKNALESALVHGKKVGSVKRGDAIALVGNSGYPGCSTGEHLHFEIRKNNTWVNPADYLKSKTIKDEEKGGETTIGNGNWDWPISDTIRLTQHFGVTPYSWRYKYSGGIHTGFDMVSTSGKVIRAPADGTLYSSSQSCGSSSTINIVYIDHGDNVYSFYLHVQ
ncbi:MAG: Peptidase, M23 family [Microgenomates group bacterium GW2011_GWF2_45_18]|nr:MAG: Peptidase, M23 family [Microgenomates group bacterium GW2011_GWF1_44_10]KKU02253.1 MAG: Peptidase, M23 family [Microgenomates group bacterium GW2011_GWF2_45_18]OGJ41253.1 MAG: hypothetical protein A2378_01675 [Candidatus Pacebacteria bacterium RIFOXYB1_FULL_44_10]HAU99282.1 hypothetical protein [Candidatus Paceibacterota bacterium]HAX01813.1 hypothetical protein [Candidatus Paceibacterota bacterium]